MLLTHDDLLSLLHDLVDSGASELHLKVPARPVVRIGDTLSETQRPATTPEYTLALATQLLSVGGIDSVALASVQHREFGFGVSGLGRFHATVYRQRGSMAIRVSRIPFEVPSLESLDLTDAVDHIFNGPGLNLVCGPLRAAGLASLVDRFNQLRSGIVVDIGDPLVYLHRDKNALIAQRGVSTDVESIREAVRQAHRQRVDLIVVSDVPDRDTAEALLRAAEDDIKVIAGVGAPDANLAASWVLRQYDGDRDLDVKARLKRLLRGIVAVGPAGQSRYVARRGALRVA